MEIEEANPNALRELLRFLYRGEVEDLDKFAAQVFELAHRYLVEGLKTYCIDYMLINVSEINVLEFYCLAKKYNVPELAEKAKRYFLE